MARLVLNETAKNEIQSILAKYKSYTTFGSSKNYLIVLEKLIKSCNDFCPFTGVLYPDRKFSIEHFHFRHSTNSQEDLTLENLYPCCQDANVPTKQRSLTLDPKIIDYVDRLYIDTSDFLVKPKDENDKEAKDTIEQFSLNKNNQLQTNRMSEYNKKFIFKTNSATKYSFSEYFN
jgi:hypothetical protein